MKWGQDATVSLEGNNKTTFIKILKNDLVKVPLKMIAGKKSRGILFAKNDASISASFENSKRGNKNILGNVLEKSDDITIDRNEFKALERNKVNMKALASTSVRELVDNGLGMNNAEQNIIEKKIAKTTNQNKEEEKKQAIYPLYL